MTLFKLLEMSDSPPTAQNYELFEDLQVRIHTVVAKVYDFENTTDWAQIEKDVK